MNILKTENERIAKLEVQLENVSEAVNRIEKLLIRSQEDTLPRKEAELRFNKASKEMAALKEEIEEIKQDKKNEKSAKEARFVSWCALAASVVIGYLNYMK
jgi:TolA-binding protein